MEIRRNPPTAPEPGAVEDNDARPSSWLTSKRLDTPSQAACSTCGGTGSSGWQTATGATITCPACHGFGY